MCLVCAQTYLMVVHCTLQSLILAYIFKWTQANSCSNGMSHWIIFDQCWQLLNNNEQQRRNSITVLTAGEKSTSLLVSCAIFGTIFTLEPTCVIVFRFVIDESVWGTWLTQHCCLLHKSTSDQALNLSQPQKCDFGLPVSGQRYETGIYRIPNTRVNGTTRAFSEDSWTDLVKKEQQTMYRLHRS
jgi:hypothetical protein